MDDDPPPRVRARAERDPFYGLRRTRPRRVMDAANVLHDALELTDVELPTQPTIRLNMPDTNAPEHLKDLYSLNRRAEIMSVSEQGGLEKVVAENQSPESLYQASDGVCGVGCTWTHL